MKRLWIGVALLAAVLVIGIALTVTFEKLHRPLAEKLEAAGWAALDENWEKAEVLTEEARADWQKLRHFTAAVADHEPLEEMDVLFARLQVGLRQRDVTNFAALCRQLAALAAAVADSQAVTWWNLL